MLTAKAFEILRYGQPAGRRILVVERNGVVDVADNGRPATPGKPAGEIPAPDGPFQCRRRLVAQRVGRTRQRIGNEQGRGSGQLTHLLGIDDAVPLQIAGLRPIGMDGLVAGYHVDDHLRPGPITIGIVIADFGGAIFLSAGACQPTAVGQGAQCVGSALIQCSRVRRAHLLGELRESSVKGRRSRGGD